MRGESRVVPAEPVVTMLVCFISFAREAAGAAGARLSLRPRCSRDNEIAELGRNKSREREVMHDEYGRQIKLSAVIPGRCAASNPESRDSPVRNCAPEVWSFRTDRSKQKSPAPAGKTGRGLVVRSYLAHIRLRGARTDRSGRYSSSRSLYSWRLLYSTT